MSNRGYIKQLEQLFNGVTKNEKLVNACKRDRLVADGFVEIVHDYNLITPDGVRAFIVSQDSTIGALNRPDTMRLLVEVATRRSRHVLPEEMGFGVEQFSRVVDDILSLSNIGMSTICFIFSGREWIEVFDGNSESGPRWKVREGCEL